MKFAGISLGRRLGATVMHKLLGIVGLCLMATVVVASIGVWQMSRIGLEIEAVAEQDMPLTGVVSQVTVHQLEQAVLLERILRMSGLVTETTAEALAAAEAEFERLSSVVDEEIVAGERLAEAALEHARTPEQRAEFEKVLSALKLIEGEHKSYHAHAAEIFELVHQGRTMEALHDLGAIWLESCALHYMPKRAQRILRPIDRHQYLADRFLHAAAHGTTSTSTGAKYAR
jgi:methyl-accepting chemotaxis protein